MGITPKYFRVESSGQTLIFSAVGSIHMLLEDEVREECAALIDQISQHHAANAVIDLGSVDYFGSIMLELMVALWKQVKTGTGKFVVCNVSTVGQQVLHTSKLDTLWTILSSREKALATLHSED